jgi:hypothetical protein
MSDWVRVEKRKYPDQTHLTWEAVELGADEYGIWLFAPQGVRNNHSAPGIQLLPSARWWVAWWWADSSRWWCAADIATPPSLAKGVWSYDDLEIDVWGDEAGFRGVVDEDEFEQARQSVPFPALTAMSALASRDEVVALMNAGTEPFGTVGWEHLRSALGRFEGTMA